MLDELATPLEIQKFFDALPGFDPAKRGNPNLIVGEAIAKAHQDSIEQTVRDQIEARQEIPAAAALWGLFKAIDKVSMRRIRELEELLADLDPVFGNGLTPMVNFQIAARNLRQTDDFVTYYHPRVEAGITRTLEGHAVPVRRYLRRLIDAFISPEGPDPTWGVAAAARLLRACERTPDLKPHPSANATAAIDAWLAQRLASPGVDLEDDLAVAAAAGSRDSVVSELARFLRHRPDRSFPAFLRWALPDRTPDWYARMKADPATQPLLSAFVAKILPKSRDDFPASFVSVLDDLAEGLTPSFLSAAKEAVYFGVISSDDVILEGALRDVPGFETVIDRAVEVLTPSEEDLAQAAQLHLDIQNGVYAEDYAEHLSHNEDGYTADIFVRGYVRHVRRVVGWQHLAVHRHKAFLLSYWLTELAGDDTDPSPTEDEIDAAYELSRGDDEASFWSVVSRHWNAKYLPALEQAIGPEGSAGGRRTALSALVLHAADAFVEMADRLAQADDDECLIEIAVALGQLARSWCRGEEAQAKVVTVIDRLPEPFGQLANAAFAIDNATPITLDDSAVARLAKIEGASEALRVFRVQVGQAYELDLERDLTWLLVNASDPAWAFLATEAAIRCKSEPLLRIALHSRYADAAALALTAIGSSLTAPLPDYILGKAAETGSPVRKALVALLRQKPHQDHLATLLTLAQDTWSRGSRTYGEDDDFPIAQSAVAAIAELGPLSRDVQKTLYKLAFETSDPDLAADTFEVVAESGGVAVQHHLLELAVKPGRSSLRRAAALALLRKSQIVDHAIIDRINLKLLTGRVEYVAAMLTLLVASRATHDRVMDLARGLATDAKRRVFVLLMIWVVHSENPEQAHAIAALLPREHPAIAWATADPRTRAADALLADLGTPQACRVVLSWINPSVR